MTTRITVNGVHYDSIEAMPPEVRQAYDKAMANLPALNDADAGGVTNVIEGESPFIKYGIAVRRRLVVNGTAYDDEASMPPEVRESFERTMRAARTGSPDGKKNEIKLTFSINGPGFSFRKGAGASPASGALPDAAADATRRLSAGMPLPTPIDPSSGGGSLRIALLFATGVVGVVALWLLFGGR